MLRKGISQEGLKLIACITMLIDHIGHAIVHPMYMDALLAGGTAALPAASILKVYYLLRIIGRIAFPIYCFLLVEGMYKTRNRKKYALRLLIGAVLSELPFNLIISGSPVWRYSQSVMVTLLLGFGAVALMDRIEKFSWKALALVPFAIVAELLSTDYGWHGIVLIGIFALSRELPNRNLIRFGGMLVLYHYVPTYTLWLGSFSIPMQALGALSMLFISCYDGRKHTTGKVAQWAFYLFYPVHLLILYGISLFIR